MLNQVQTNQLVASLRDAMMDEVRRHAPKLTESDQRDMSETLTSAAMELVDAAVDAIACEDFPRIDVELDNFDAKGKVTLKVKNIGEGGPRLITLRGAHLALVLTNPARFDEKRPAPKIEPDQPPLFQGEAEDDSQKEGPAIDGALTCVPPAHSTEATGFRMSCPVSGERAGQFGLLSPVGHILCWHHHDAPIAAMVVALNTHEHEHGPIIGHAKAVEIAGAAIPKGYSVVFEPDPSSTEANSVPAGGPESAAGARRGRPSRADMQAATEAGRQAFRNGTPLKDPPAGYGNTLTQCWAAGWRAAEAEEADAKVPAEMVPAATGLPAPAEAAE
jgi:hypothetical protein